MGIDPSQLATGAAMWMCLVALLSFHEYGHAWAAHKCGDDTARVMGRMTINPIVHIAPIGTVLIPWVIIFFVPDFYVFGWAKPVPVNPSNYGNRKRDDIFVSMAGPAVNIVLAVVLMVVFYLVGAWPEKLSVQHLWEN
ncbi:MAG: site-2 protease family protein, partial [Verrucomicrobiota bacterium]|nr:site-2 protease family protein [Verrucomicrobiota bacterium]